MNAWNRLDDGHDTQTIGFRSVVFKKFRMNNGMTMNATIIDKQDNRAAIVIPLTTDKKVVIARQFRCGPEKVLEELPGGIVDPGEIAEDAARRELLEETGYVSNKIVHIGDAYINAWSNTLHHYFIAYDCEKSVESKPEEFEEIEVNEISISQLLLNAREACMTDIQGIFLAYDILKQLEEPS